MTAGTDSIYWSKEAWFQEKNTVQFGSLVVYTEQQVFFVAIGYILTVSKAEID